MDLLVNLDSWFVTSMIESILGGAKYGIRCRVNSGNSVGQYSCRVQCY